MQKPGEVCACASRHSSSEMSVKHSAEYLPYSSLDNHFLAFHGKRTNFLSPTVTDELMFKQLNLPFILKKNCLKKVRFQKKPLNKF